MITQKDDSISVDFKNFDTESYKIFLQSKKLPEYNLTYDWKTDSYQLKCPARFAHVFGMKENYVDKWASNYQSGYTIFRILVDLGLMTEKKRLTIRGRQQLWEFFRESYPSV